MRRGAGVEKDDLGGREEVAEMKCDGGANDAGA